MSDPTPTMDLATKIARLAEEKGFNQEDFANISGLNRQTVRQILQPSGDRSLRNSTVEACARTLGLSVYELRTLPLERLLPKVRAGQAREGAGHSSRLHDLATQPELRAWVESHPERSKALTDEEVEELLSLQGPDGALVRYGVEQFVSHIERRRELIEKVREIAASDRLPLLEQLVDLIHDSIQPRGAI